MNAQHCTIESSRCLEIDLKSCHPENRMKVLSRFCILIGLPQFTVLSRSSDCALKCFDSWLTDIWGYHSSDDIRSVPVRAMVVVRKGSHEIFLFSLNLPDVAFARLSNLVS